MSVKEMTVKEMAAMGGRATAKKRTAAERRAYALLASRAAVKARKENPEEWRKIAAKGGKASAGKPRKRKQNRKTKRG